MWHQIYTNRDKEIFSVLIFMLSPFACIITSFDTNDQHHSQAYPYSRVVRLNCVVVIYKFIKRYKTCHIYKHVFMLIRRHIFYIATPNSWVCRHVYRQALFAFVALFTFTHATDVVKWRLGFAKYSWIDKKLKKKILEFYIDC